MIMGKVAGKIVGQAHGITVTVKHNSAKTSKGKNRMWLQIRQNEGKKWKVYESLVYPHGADIAFVEEQ
jgi:hypothetical protein